MKSIAKHFIPRLFVDKPLKLGSEIIINAAQTHYLLKVMRQKAGDELFLFNGVDGEWSCEVLKLAREVSVKILKNTRPQTEPIDLCLLFSPLRNTRTSWVVQKAAELGVKTLQPIIAEHSIVRKINLEKLTSNAIEGAEQSESLFVPKILTPLMLEDALDNWDKNRALVFCDEDLANDKNPTNSLSALSHLCNKEKFAILVGPEGGFTKEERDLVKSISVVQPLRLGANILRAETAILAALVLFQAQLGDWQNERYC